MSSLAPIPTPVATAEPVRHALAAGRRWIGPAVLAALVLLMHGWMLSQWPGGQRQRGPGPRKVSMLAALRAPVSTPAPATPMAEAPAIDQVAAPATTTQAARAVAAEAIPSALAPPGVRSAQAAPAAPASAPARPEPEEAHPEGTLAAVGAEDPGPPGDGDAAGPAEPPPTYPTRLPDPVRLPYRLNLSQRSADAQLTWAHDGQQYRLVLDAAGRQPTSLLLQTSEGRFDAAGLAPDRFVDRRGGRGARAANFRRDIGRITFSGPRIEHPAWAGAQDRLSWIAQLAAICAAAGGMPSQVSMFVVDGRGLGEVWTFAEQGTAAIATPLGQVQATQVVREPQRLIDWRVQVWLDPQRGWWPVALRMTVPRSGAVFELQLAGEPMALEKRP